MDKDQELAKAAHNTAYIFNEEVEIYANEIDNWHEEFTERLRLHAGTNADNAISALCTELRNDRNAIRAKAERIYALVTIAEYADFLTEAEILAEVSRLFIEARQAYEHAQRLNNSLFYEKIIRKRRNF